MTKSEFALAFNEVLEDKQLSEEIILGAIESAMVSAYRRAVNASSAQHVEAKVDLETGQMLIYAEKEVVEDVVDERTEVLLEEAKRFEPDVQLGDIAIVETTPTDFGRVAAQTAQAIGRNRQWCGASQQCPVHHDRVGHEGRGHHARQPAHSP